MKRDEMQCLKDGEWLDDKVIEIYMRLVVRRSRSGGEQFRRLEVVKNSFFYTKLTKEGKGYDYSSVRSWTRKPGILDTDAILVPINVNGNHWVLGVVNLTDKRIEFYDSMRGPAEKHFQVLRRWIKDEWLDKKKQQLDLSQWEDYTPPRCPQQNNGIDCGVFVCKFADCVGRQLDLNGQPAPFGQQHMTLFRRRLCLELIRGKME